ncbi:hypothetical protein [Streptomyces winkii]|uniref:hypothetical protein n=1 Tax=Streptomyces winkii TaxID=3051178 RepID=UPI0028D636C4|nr:hypothetical protein [Streptomyces sp. DSM 40971]
MSSPEAVNRLVVFADTCGSGQMNIAAKRRTREGMYEAFAKAFASVGVNEGEMHQEDRGDGILAALDPGVPSSLMVGRWLSTLYESLREHNTVSATRLRMRVAMHMGPVVDDGKGLVGRAVDVTCRLCDSEEAKATIARADGSDLLHVVSDWLYANVVAEGGRYIEPDHYRQVRVENKEADELAWFRVPGLPGPPMTVPPPARRAGGGVPAAGPGPLEPAAQHGPGHQVPGTKNQFNVAGDSLYFEGGRFENFTGIRKDRPQTGGSEA